MISKQNRDPDFCYLPFGRPSGALYRRLICAAFSCKSFLPFFLGLQI